MNENLSSMAFDILSRRIGSEVSCKVRELGIDKKWIEKIYTGVLKDVVPFDGINLDDRLIPFVGPIQAIETVTLTEDGRTVFANPHVRGYKGVPGYDIMGLAEAQRAYLGKSVMDEIQNGGEGRRHK